MNTYFRILAGLVVMLLGPAVQAQENAAEPPTLLDQAQAKYDQSDYEGAIADCTQALEEHPNDAEAYHLRIRARVWKTRGIRNGLGNGWRKCPRL